MDLRMKEIELIKTAILNEKEGEIFYNMTSEKAENPDVKQAFKFLAEEEIQHRQWLEGLYKDLIDKKQITLEEMLGNHVESPHIFIEANKKIEPGSLEVSAFGIGIKMEKASIEFYEKAAATTQLPELKKIYQSLIKWEYKHLEHLEKIYDRLKELWWEEQGFSPS